MGERTDAYKLAERLLSEPGADPDDELRMLSRQLLRSGEKIQRYEKLLSNQDDGTEAMVNSNRDSILKKHEEAVRLIRNCMAKETVTLAREREYIGRVLDALLMFHPMHGESWQGWPKESA